MPLAVRGRRQRVVHGVARGEAEHGLADAQEGAGGEADRAVGDGAAVDRRAVRRAEVGDRDAAVRVQGDRAVQPGDVRVVEGDVGLRGAADTDLAAVQQVHAARVGARDHVQPGGGLGQVGARLGGGADGEDGAVDQGRLAERAALEVEAVRLGVEDGGALARGHGRGQAGGDRGEGGPGGGGDEHVAGRRGASPRLGLAATRPEDGQPDLHRRQRSLPALGARHGDSRCDSPHRTRARRPVRTASSHLPLTTRPPPTRI
ncbi:hypothetical protein SMD44_03301 [Streptomyces alboflavus]|uniref:Uncharacterized protein n=1 Tax=Streptomyces alboflavus TaxID=67267 RepID=A0A1Z1WBQ3_9ACTN|nr:hypothetical protein SMD44_03301 [Streptomyces alboflavus]